MNDDLGRKFLLEGFPNPERKGCPDESALRALAEDRLPAGDPIRLHLGSCSECYAEYLHYRKDIAELQPPKLQPAVAAGSNEWNRTHSVPVGGHAHGVRWVPLALAASLLIVCGGGFVAFEHQHASTTSTSQNTSLEPISASIDLFNSGTLRGTSEDATPLQQVALPAAIVRMSVVLPRFSDVGPYTVLVSRDKAGTQVVARGTGEASQRDGKVAVQVTVDLRAAKPGSYFLATVRGADNGTYYYPLRIN